MPGVASFQPKNPPRNRELEYARVQFNTVEVDGSFYRLQRPENFAAWCDAAPKSIRFAIKRSRFIPHNETALERENGTRQFLCLVGHRSMPNASSNALRSA